MVSRSALRSVSLQKVNVLSPPAHRPETRGHIPQSSPHLPYEAASPFIWRHEKSELGSSSSLFTTCPSSALFVFWCVFW